MCVACYHSFVGRGHLIFLPYRALHHLQAHTHNYMFSFLICRSFSMMLKGVVRGVTFAFYSNLLKSFQFLIISMILPANFYRYSFIKLRRFPSILSFLKLGIINLNPQIVSPLSMVSGPWDHDLSRMQMLNPLSHPGAPVSLIFPIVVVFFKACLPLISIMIFVIYFLLLTCSFAFF